MTTSVEIQYVSPLTFRVHGDETPEPGLSLEPGDGAQNDLGFFMATAGKFALLKAEDERRIGHTLWACRLRLLRILREARGKSYPSTRARPPRTTPVTASTRRRLARVEALARRSTGRNVPSATRKALREALSEMDLARQELAESNLRLVVWVAKSFRGRGFDFIDLIQEGSLGLLRAIDRFDPAVGARFSTFATHWIQQGIRRALAEKARAIRIPVNRIPEVRQTLHARTYLAERLGRTAQPEEIADEIGLPIHKLKELLPAIAPIDSIDAPIASTERLLGDTLVDRKIPSPLDEAMEEERQRVVSDALHELPDRQRVILSMRHGIGYPKECTLEEIGDALGLSRERIRQVEKVAVESVKTLLRKNGGELAQPV